MATTVGYQRIARHKDRTKYTEAEIENARYNNQFVISGNNPELKNEAFTFFLEYVIGAPSAFNVEDVLGNDIGIGISDPLDLTHTPLRLDGGFKIDGLAIKIAKGFTIAHESGNHELE